MIRLIQGKILSKTEKWVVVLTLGGLGYQVYTTTAGMESPTGTDTVLHTHLVVRENLMQLYGFLDNAELEVFELLIQVNGVGPKGALSILNLGNLERLSQAIGSGDSGYISLASGIGKKTASKIVIELRDKISTLSPTGVMGGSQRTSNEIVEALRSLGYSASQIKSALDSVDQELSVEEQLKKALRVIGGMK